MFPRRANEETVAFSSFVGAFRLSMCAFLDLSLVDSNAIAERARLLFLSTISCHFCSVFATIVVSEVSRFKHISAEFRQISVFCIPRKTRFKL